MSDFDKVELYGITYNVKDTTARDSISATNEEVPVITYDETKTQIKITKGV